MSLAYSGIPGSVLAFGNNKATKDLSKKLGNKIIDIYVCNFKSILSN